MKKAILILLVFGSAFVAAWFLLKPKETAANPAVPVPVEDEPEVYEGLAEGAPVYEGSMISSTSDSSTTSTPTTTSTTISASGRRSTSSFTVWNEKPLTPFK